MDITLEFFNYKGQTVASNFRYFVHLIMAEFKEHWQKLIVYNLLIEKLSIFP
jgi:hypothetical protein